MLFKTKNNVPDVYIEQSRDFQTISAALDCLYNTIISNQIKENYIDDLEIVDSKLLGLISEYLGFFTNNYFPENLLRSILINFPTIIKYKGSDYGIRNAVKSLENAFYDATQIILRKKDNYTWDIETDGVIIDQKYIDEVLKYVLPAGAIIESFKVINIINNIDPTELGTSIDDGLLFNYKPGDDTTGEEDEFNYNNHIFGQIRVSGTDYGSENKLNTLLGRINNTPIVTTSKKLTIKQGNIKQ